jgi:hypothetical protein
MHELRDRVQEQIFLVKGIRFNFKVDLLGKLGPLKIQFAYPGNPIKTVRVFISHDNKDPSSHQHMASYLNPNTIQINAEMDPKISKQVFTKPFLYLALQTETDLTIKIMPKFRDELAKGVAPKKGVSSSENVSAPAAQPRDED